ncbi:hypothetical protein P879_02810 [Paragonimus westermani]|uniref:Uncharacterized protein n=1 Tax=Paragonimus westermani TaxID=34504 RepID=A0A8T0DQY8_9TREM|nr:hypothetical protein P879_02810 [Paragonimus westermani]
MHSQRSLLLVFQRINYFQSNNSQPLRCQSAQQPWFNQQPLCTRAMDTAIVDTVMSSMVNPTADVTQTILVIVVSCTTHYRGARCAIYTEPGEQQGANGRQSETSGCKDGCESTLTRILLVSSICTLIVMIAVFLLCYCFQLCSLRKRRRAQKLSSSISMTQFEENLGPRKLLCEYHRNRCVCLNTPQSNHFIPANRMLLSSAPRDLIELCHEFHRPAAKTPVDIASSFMNTTFYPTNMFTEHDISYPLSRNFSVPSLFNYFVHNEHARLSGSQISPPGKSISLTSVNQAHHSPIEQPDNSLTNISTFRPRTNSARLSPNYVDLTRDRNSELPANSQQSDDKHGQCKRPDFFIKSMEPTPSTSVTRKNSALTSQSLCLKPGCEWNNGYVICEAPTEIRNARPHHMFTVRNDVHKTDHKSSRSNNFYQIFEQPSAFSD